MVTKKEVIEIEEYVSFNKGKFYAGYIGKNVLKINLDRAKQKAQKMIDELGCGENIIYGFCKMMTKCDGIVDLCEDCKKLKERLKIIK